MQDTVKTPERRIAPRAAVLALVGLLITPLSGCLPGFGSDDDVGGSELSGGDLSPAVNRSYKGNSLPFHAASLGPEQASGGTSGARELLSATLARLNPLQDSRPTAAEPPFPPYSGEREPAILPPVQALRSFYEALSAIASGKRKEPVSILHFGDEHIADDHFSGELREHFLSRFGNGGRGIMTPGLYPIKDMRVERGGHWTLASSAAGSPGVFSLTGVRVSANANDAWMRFTAVSHPFDWVEVSFAGGPAQGDAAISIDGVVKIVPTATRALQETSIRIAAKGREIVIRPKGNGEIAVLSVNTGIDAPGVRYANLGLPGASAITFAKWNADFVANDLKKLNPDLIILTYGTREGFEDQLDLSQYQTRLNFLLGKFREWAPQASILIVGPPDAARLPSYAGAAGAQVCRALNTQELANYERLLGREDERLARWHSPPNLERVRMVMKREAAATGAYYWDWSKFMGGPCSIHAWAYSTPALAAQDHVTLTQAGNERSARALYTELMHGYDAYQRVAQSPAQPHVASASHPEKAAKPKKLHKVKH